MRVVIEIGLVVIAFFAGRGYQATKDTLKIRRNVLGNGKRG